MQLLQLLPSRQPLQHLSNNSKAGTRHCALMASSVPCCSRPVTQVQCQLVSHLCTRSLLEVLSHSSHPST